MKELERNSKVFKEDVVRSYSLEEVLAQAPLHRKLPLDMNSMCVWNKNV